jgi:hypothetical protein
MAEEVHKEAAAPHDPVQTITATQPQEPLHNTNTSGELSAHCICTEVDKTHASVITAKLHKELVKKDSLEEQVMLSLSVIETNNKPRDSALDRQSSAILVLNVNILSYRQGQDVITHFKDDIYICACTMANTPDSDRGLGKLLRVGKG